MILPTHVVGAGGIILNDGDEILLVKNPRKGWEFPGGIVEEGETIPQGLIREIKEETGVDIEIITIVGIYSNTNKQNGYNGVKEIPTIVTIDFICKYIYGELSLSDESVDIRWCLKEEALKMVNKRQQIRLLNALNYKGNMFCLGYELNSLGEIKVHEKYMFNR